MKEHTHVMERKAQQQLRRPRWLNLARPQLARPSQIGAKPPQNRLLETSLNLNQYCMWDVCEAEDLSAQAQNII
jgi:hypothetical protein